MRVELRTIPDGLGGTEATLAEIFRQIEAGQVDPRIIRFTRNAIGRTSFKRERTLIRKATRAWIKRVRILEDPVRHEFIQSPARSLMEGRGDCDDLVAGVGASLEHIGFPVELVVGSQSMGGANDFTHVWIRTWLPRAGRWLPVDPRGMAQFGWGIGRELPPSQLTAVRAYGWDEDAGRLVPGGSLMPQGRIGRLPGEKTQGLRPTSTRPTGARFRPISRLRGMGQIRLRPAKVGRLGQQFPFVEASTPIASAATAVAPAPPPAPAAPEQPGISPKIVTGLTIAFLVTGIARNLFK